MSDYSQITNFTAKDNLLTGDPDKVIEGADIDAELSAIATAITSKYDSADTQVAYKTTTETKTSDTTLAADSELTGLTLAANQKYLVEAWLYVVQAHTDPNFKLRCGGSASSTGIQSAAWGKDAANPLISYMTSSGNEVMTMDAGNYLINIHGYIDVGATAGTFSIMWAQSVSSANNTQVVAGSWCKLTKV